jgi:hypothetical protein
MARYKALGAMALVAIPLLSIIIFLILTGESPPYSFDPNLKNQLAALLPPLAVFAGGCLAVAMTRGFVMATAMSFLGLVSAYMLYQLNDQGILVPQMLVSWGFTVPELQATTIIVFFLVGAVLGAATRN